MNSASKKITDKKPVLAIETSDRLCGVSVYFDEEKFYSLSVNQKNMHAEKLFPSIEYLLKESGMTSRDLDSVAVSHGPGSFTGLRIGMSAAKGIAMGAGIPIIPVPTFEVIAFQIYTFLNEGDYFVIANKMNRDEVYYAKFQVKSNNYIFAETLAILHIEDCIKKSKGIKTFGSAFINSDDSQNQVNNLFAPLPEKVAQWAIKFGQHLKTFDYNFIEPNYLKIFKPEEIKK